MGCVVPRKKESCANEGNSAQRCRQQTLFGSGVQVLILRSSDNMPLGNTVSVQDLICPSLHGRMAKKMSTRLPRRRLVNCLPHVPLRNTGLGGSLATGPSREQFIVSQFKVKSKIIARRTSANRINPVCRRNAKPLREDGQMKNPQASKRAVPKASRRRFVGGWSLFKKNAIVQLLSASLIARSGWQANQA